MAPVTRNRLAEQFRRRKRIGQRSHTQDFFTISRPLTERLPKDNKTPNPKCYPLTDCNSCQASKSCVAELRLTDTATSGLVTLSPAASRESQNPWGKGVGYPPVPSLWSLPPALATVTGPVENFVKGRRPRYRLSPPSPMGTMTQRTQFSLFRTACQGKSTADEKTWKPAVSRLMAAINFERLRRRCPPKGSR
jgi:hypothetical protein